jgi:hypothetical protein
MHDSASPAFRSLSDFGRLLLSTSCLVIAGCHAPLLPADTGSRDAVRGYFQAIIRQDWALAHAALDRESRSRCPRDEFADLAARYRVGLGFQPEEVRLRSCEEQGERAVAQVLIRGRAGQRRRLFKDAVTLRRDEGKWGVVLPARFGRGPVP